MTESKLDSLAKDYLSYNTSRRAKDRLNIYRYLEQLGTSSCVTDYSDKILKIIQNTYEKETDCHRLDTGAIIFWWKVNPLMEFLLCK